MFTHHGTHIVGLTAASKHVAMALQPATMISFETTERNWWLLRCWGAARGKPRAAPFAHRVAVQRRTSGLPSPRVQQSCMGVVRV